MSMETSMIYGFGFKTNKINNNILFNYVRSKLPKVKNNYKDNDYNTRFETVIRLLKEHNFNFETKNLFTEIETILKNNDDDVLDKLNIDDFIFDLRNTLLNCVAAIMEKENNIWIEYQQGQEGCIGEEGAIMLTQSLPWSLNKTEKELTQEKFIKICKSYTKDLGIPNEPIEDIIIEYFG